jgi:hypothetical protein
MGKHGNKWGDNIVCLEATKEIIDSWGLGNSTNNEENNLYFKTYLFLEIKRVHREMGNKRLHTHYQIIIVEQSPKEFQSS